MSIRDDHQLIDRMEEEGQPTQKRNDETKKRLLRRRKKNKETEASQTDRQRKRSS